MTETVSRRLARFVAGLEQHSLPPPVVAKAKERILDGLSTAIAGRGLPVPTVATAIAGTNTGAATIIGRRGGVPAADAAFVNATLINGRTQDDFLCKSHPGAVSIPPALALAEEGEKSGGELIAAVVAGYELTARAYLGGPAMLPAFRATGVAGAIGAGAASARIMGLGEDETVHALGLSAIFSSGFGAGFHAGTMDVKLNVGMAARNGVTAAVLVRAGATATERAFEDEAGYYNAHGGRDHVEAATEGLGERWLIQDTVYKEYPVCIFVQTPVILAQALMAREGLKPSNVAHVRIAAPEETYTNPGFRNLAPFANALKARVSARFCVAAAVLGRPIGDFAFYDRVDDPEVLAMADRIELSADPSRSTQVSLSIETTAGRIVSIDGSEGETLHPDEAKIVAKFRRLARPILGFETETVLDMVMSLERLKTIRQLTDQLKGAALVRAAS